MTRMVIEVDPSKVAFNSDDTRATDYHVMVGKRQNKKIEEMERLSRKRAIAGLRGETQIEELKLSGPPSLTEKVM